MAKQFTPDPGPWTLAALLKNLQDLRVYEGVWITADRRADVVDMRDLAEAIGAALVAKAPE